MMEMQIMKECMCAISDGEANVNAEVTGLSPAERQLKEFNRLTNQLVEQAEKDIIPEVEVQQTHMRLEMKEKQMSELSDAMTSYSPSEELNRKYKEEAKLAALEAQKFRDEVLRRIQEEIERKKKEEKDKEEEKKRQMEEHYKKLAADLEADQQREEQRLNEREAEKQRLKEKQLQERRRNEEEEIRKSNLSESEKERLLHEHSDNMEKLEQNLNEEQNRSKSALAAKLEARKKRRQGTEHAKLSKQMQLDADAEQKKHLAQKQQEEALMEEQAMVGKTETSNVLIGEIPQGVTPEIELPTTKTGVKLTGNLEQDWVNLLMASPLFQKINDLENMIDNADLSGQGQPSRVKGADYSTRYIDVKDAQWSCKGDLSPADANQISPSQFVVYRFGIFLIKLLHQSIGTPEVSLLLASNLPPNNYTHNAFRNSVYYEHARNILFVRKERVESIGEFAVLILHAVSHIKCGEMTDDGNALFLRQFYKCLKVIYQDMFFSRSHGSTVAQSLIGSPAPNSRPALEKALAPFSRKEPDRENVIGELVDMKVDGPTRADFSSQRLSQRLIGYENMASNARLRQYLGSKGGFVASSDFVSSRMAELRGSNTTAAPKPSPQKRMPPPIHVPAREIVDTQLVELQSKCDKLNEELSDTLKMEAGLREAVRQLETDPTEVNDLQAASQKLESELLRKNELLLRISSTEADIMKKEKELKLKRK